MLIVISTARHSIVATLYLNENDESSYNDNTLSWPQIASLALKNFSEGNFSSDQVNVLMLDDDDVVTAKVYNFNAGELSYRATASCSVADNM